MSLNKLTNQGGNGSGRENWMDLSMNTLTADNVTLKGNQVLIETKDNSGFNNFSTQSMGQPNNILITDGNGNLNFIDIGTIDPSPPDLSVYEKTQNIKLPETTVGNTQIDGTTDLDVVLANTLTLNGNNVETDISALQEKTTDIVYNSGITTTTISNTLNNPSLIHAGGNIQVDGKLDVQCSDANILNYKTPNRGTNGQVLTSDGLGNVSFQDASGGGSSDLDFTGLVGSVIKTDLSTQTTQQKYGSIEKYTALNNLSAGQPVLYDYTSGNIKVSSIGSLPSQHEIAGICLSDTAIGNTVDVLTRGFVTARRTSTFLPSSETVILNNTTNGTIRGLTNNTTFTDSGSGGNYQPNENYSITFDAGVGYTVNCTVNSFAFEHTTSQMYDRLGIQTSTDGVNYSNISVSWLQASSNSSPTWSTSFAGSSWNSGSSSPGYILPKDTTRAILLGGVPGNTFPALISLGTRYVRFYFFSDGSSQDDGWNITLQPNTPYPTSAESVAEGTTLYLDNTDYTKVSTDNTSQIVLGYCSYSNADDNSLLINCKPPSS